MDLGSLQGYSGKQDTVYSTVGKIRSKNNVRSLLVWDLSHITDMILQIIWMLEPGYMRSVLSWFLISSWEVVFSLINPYLQEICLGWVTFYLMTYLGPHSFNLNRIFLIWICLACSDLSFWPEHYSKINGPERIMFFTLDFWGAVQPLS